MAGAVEKIETNEEILALTKHIEQYLDVLMFFTQETDEVVRLTLLSLTIYRLRGEKIHSKVPLLNIPFHNYYSAKIKATPAPPSAPAKGTRSQFFSESP